MQPSFSKIFLLAALLSGCAPTLKILEPKFGITAAVAPEPFSEFHSLAGILSGSPGAWILGKAVSIPAVWAEQQLVSKADSSRRVTVYQAEFPPGEFTRESIENSLAYLFKVDASKTPPPSGLENFRVFLPPTDSTQCGLLQWTDSSLVFLQVQGLPDSLAHGCRLTELEITPAAGSAPVTGRNSRRFLAVLLNTVGLKALEDSALKIADLRFQQALAVDSTVPEYLANQAAVFALRNDPAAGMNLLLRHPDLLSRSGQLCGILGSFHEELNRYPESRDWALRALEMDPDNPEWLINLSDALWGMGERVQSKNVLLKHFADKPDFRFGVYLAGTHLGLEEYENAMAVLEQVHVKAKPTAKSEAYVLRACLGLKRFEEGLKRIHDWGDGFVPNAENLFLQAACRFNLKLFRQASESVQQSLLLNPSDREAQELQTRIAALLGDKSNQFLRSPIEPLRTGLTGSQIWKQAQDSGTAALTALNPISLFHQQIVHQWLPRGRWKQTRQLFFVVPDSRHLIRFSELTFDVNSGYERFYVNRLQVYDSLWRPVAAGRSADYYVTKNFDASLHPENLIVHLPLRLKPGKIFVEALVTFEAQLPSQEFPFVHFDHGAAYPVWHSRFEILHPPKNLIVSAFGDARVDSLPDRLSVNFGSPTLPADTRLVPNSEELGSGFSASPFTTWREVGMRYLGELKTAGIEIPKPPFRVVEVAGEILGRPGLDPVRTLFRYVRDSIRYDNYEFSRNASIPDSASLVLSKGFSDCKGTALLLSQLMVAAGFQAFPALVNLQRTGDPGQPNVGQFNHMIVYFPRQKGMGPYFLDPTEKFSAFRRFPLHLEGRNALMLDPENPRLMAIPELDSSGEHSVQVFHDLEVDGTRMARARDSLVLRGKAAAEFREHLNGWNPATRNQNLLSWLSSSYSAFNEDSFRILGEKDPDEPLVFVLRHHGRFPALDGSQSFNHFPRLELSFLRFPDAANRRSPVNFPHEVQVQSNWIYRLPPGFAWKSLSLAREIEEDALRWRFSIQQNEPGIIALKQQWRISPFFAEPEEYRRLRSEWDPVLEHCGLRLMISKM